MSKRLFDIVFAVFFLLLCSPMFVFAVAGIVLTSHGPVFYRAQRIGQHGKTFIMYKFRTMHVVQDHSSKLTLSSDPRIFPFGSLLRTCKIDELPQFFHVLLGTMSVVGPRPEDPELFEKLFKEDHRHIYRMKPGLFSPASIYEYTHGSRYLRDDDLEKSYEAWLDIKVALDLVYMKHQDLWYDIRLLFRCAWAIFATLLGKSNFPDPPELKLIEIEQIHGAKTKTFAT